MKYILPILLITTVLLFGYSIPTQFQITVDPFENQTLRDLPSNSIIDIVKGNDDVVYFGTSAGVGYSSIIDENLTFNTIESNNLVEGGNPSTIFRNNILAFSGVKQACMGANSSYTYPYGTGITYSINFGEDCFLKEQPVDYNGTPYTTFEWGGQILESLSINSPYNNVSYSLEVVDSYLYATSWAGGFRRFNYIENGDWEIIALPMDSQESLICGEIDTETFYQNPIDPPTGSHNHKGFSVHYDGTFIWVGTANGINRGTFDYDNCINWVHFTSEDNGFSGNWVIDIKHQILNDFTRIWAITWGTNFNEGNGLSYSDNNGLSWETVDILENIRVYNISEIGDTLFASTENGLYYTFNNDTWFQLLSPSENSYKVYSSLLLENDFLLVGTPDGLYSTDNLGESWQSYLFNVEEEELFCPIDLNDDDLLNILDIIILVNWIINDQPYEEMADYNNDSVINIEDIIIIVDWIINSN